MPKLRLGNAVVCEFIAHGLNNKVTLVNGYAGDIFVGNFPAQIPLAFYVELFPDFTSVHNGNISLYLGRQKIANMTVDFAFIEGQPNLVVAPTASILIEKPCVLRMVIEADGHKPIKAIRKNIKLNAELLTTA